MLTEWTKRLRGTLNTFTQVEAKRRKQVNKESLSQLPFGVPILSESQAPKVEVTLVTGVEALGNKTFGYEEVESAYLSDYFQSLVIADKSRTGLMARANEE